MSAVQDAMSQNLLQAVEDQLEINNGNIGTHAEETITEVLVSEATHLLPQGQASQPAYILSDPKGAAIVQAEGIALGLVAPLLSRISDAERIAESYDYQHNWVAGFLLETFILSYNACKKFIPNIQEHSLAIAPTVSVGHLSTPALAATAVASLFANVTGYSIVRGLTSALDLFLAESPSHRLARLRCERAALISVLALAPILQLWYHADIVFLYLKQEPEVTNMAYLFIKVTAIGLPAFMVNEIMKRYLPSQGLMSVQTAVLTAVAPLNMMMNYILVHGPKSLNLGFIGAPLSMAISYIAVAMLTLFYASCRKPQRGTEADAVLHPNFIQDIKGLFLGGLAGIGRSASEYWSKEFSSGAASFLGINALATQAVLLVTASTAYLVPSSLATASVSRVKMLLGKGDIYKAVFASVTGLLNTLVAVILLSNVLLVFAPSWAALFTGDPAVIQSVAAALPFISLYLVIHGFSAWLDGMLGVIGKTAVYPALCASFDYSIGIPLGFWLAFVHQWGLPGLWAGLMVAMAVASIVGCIVLLSSVWRSPPSMVLVGSAIIPKVDARIERV